MHELSVSSAIVDTALRHAKGRKVTAVAVKIGSLRQVVAESLTFYFEIVARDTLCEGAVLEIDHVSALMWCQACGQEWDPAPPPIESGASTAARLGYASQGHEQELMPVGEPVLPVFRCPACEAAGAQVVHGDELEVESIEVSDNASDNDREEQQCIAPG